MKRKILKFVGMSILSLSVLALLGACGKSEIPDMPPAPATSPSVAPQETGSRSLSTAPPVSAPMPTAKPPAVAIRIDACSLVSQAEVEAAIGRKVLAPEKDEVANMFVCYYGDPEAGMEDGRPVSQMVTVSIFAASGEMRDGASAPARDAFEVAKKNAASIQEIVGLTDEAYWDSTSQSLHLLKGYYSIEINISAENASFDSAKKLATKVLAKLP